MKHVVFAVMALSLGFAVPVGASAQSTNAPTFAGRASERQLAEFKNAPNSILTNNPIGGLQMTSLVKSLVLADTANVGQLVSLASQANSAQAGAIGSGIGQAISQIRLVDAALADQLAQIVAGSNSQTLLTAYNASTGGVQTASTGTGAGGVGGGVGGPVGGTSTGSSGSSTVGSTASLPGNFGSANTLSSVASSTTGGLGGGSSVTCTRTVSPNRAC